MSMHSWKKYKSTQLPGHYKKYQKAITHNVLLESHTTAHIQCIIQVSDTVSLALQTYVTLSTTTLAKMCPVYTCISHGLPMTTIFLLGLTSCFTMPLVCCLSGILHVGQSAEVK